MITTSFQENGIIGAHNITVEILPLLYMTTEEGFCSLLQGGDVHKTLDEPQ